MKVFLVLFTVLTTFPTWADTLESRFLKQIAKAKTPSEVFQLNRDYEDLKEARAACQIQWRRNWVPLACYAVLKQEIRQGFHAEDANRRRLEARLDERCRESSALIYQESVPTPGERELKAPVSAACRRFIENARKVHAYRIQGRVNWSEN